MICEPVMPLTPVADGDGEGEPDAAAEAEAEAGAAAVVAAPFDPHAVAPTARAAQSTAERTSRVESMTILQRNEWENDQIA
jgi:AmiR/NasT family two-component response regulator